MNGAQSLFKALVDAGVTTCFANPGTSEMQLVYEIGLSEGVRPILCLQEDVVTGAADGYGRMKGAPAFTLLHVGSGFANGVAMLHNAGRANTPIVNVVGANASYHQPNYPEHEFVNGRIADIARVVSHWAEEARSASDLGAFGVKAAAFAKTGKVATIIARTNRHWDEANPPSAPETWTRAKATAEAIEHARRLLTNGKKTGLVLGNLALHGEALETAARIAAKSGAALLGETFASSYLARGEGRPLLEPIPYEYEMGVNFLKNFEQLVFVGALFPVATFAYRDKPTFKSPAGCELYEMATAEQDLPSALAMLSRALDAEGVSVPRAERASPSVPSGPLTAASIGASLTNLMPENAILVDEAATNGPPIIGATQGARRHDYLNPLTGGAIGGGMPMALGAAIACPDRKVIALQADGSGMYALPALWTMAREKANVAIVLLRNDRYNILGLELARVRDSDVNARMDSMLSLANPSIDWVAAASGLGVRADKAESAEGFHALLATALAEFGPRLIECVVPIPEEWLKLEALVHNSR